MESKEDFTFKNREEVIRFENLIKSYNEKRFSLHLDQISLVKAYDYLYGLYPNNKASKIFTALFDIYINFMLLYYEFSDLGGTWNRFFSKGKLEGGSLLDSEEKFFGKIDIHRFSSNFIFRYRALWDKIMGFLILMYDFDNHQKFNDAKSKKRTFKKLANEIKGISKDSIDSIDLILKTLEKFDSEFRTAEAHGTGSLRKSSLSMSQMPDNPLFKLIDYWEAIWLMFILIGKMFDHETEL